MISDLGFLDVDGDGVSVPDANSKAPNLLPEFPEPDLVLDWRHAAYPLSNSFSVSP